MKRTINQDGTVSYTVSQTEKIIITGILAYFWGRRVGYYAGRSAMANEIDKTGRPKP